MTIGTRIMCVKFPENQTNTVGGVAILKTFESHRQIDSQTDKQTDRQTDRHTQRQTDASVTYTVSCTSCKPAAERKNCTQFRGKLH